MFALDTYHNAGDPSVSLQYAIVCPLGLARLAG
jgi:hypothetical protein